jgi:hypothetical protein
MIKTLNELLAISGGQQMYNLVGQGGGVTVYGSNQEIAAIIAQSTSRGYQVQGGFVSASPTNPSSNPPIDEPMSASHYLAMTKYDDIYF